MNTVSVFVAFMIEVKFYSYKEGLDGEYADGNWWHSDRGLHSSSVTSIRGPSKRISTREMRLTITISSLSAPTLPVWTPWLVLRLRGVCVAMHFCPAPLDPVWTAYSMVKSLRVHPGGGGYSVDWGWRVRCQSNLQGQCPWSGEGIS